MRYFSVIGTSYCVVIDGDMPPNCDVEMSEYRPAGDYISDALGNWVSYTPAKEYSSQEFIERFSVAELELIYTHAETVSATSIWLGKIASDSQTSNEDTTILIGMSYFVYQALISQARHDVILG